MQAGFQGCLVLGLVKQNIDEICKIFLVGQKMRIHVFVLV